MARTKKNAFDSQLERELAWKNREPIGPYGGGTLCLVTHGDRVDIVHEWNYRGKIRKAFLGNICCSGHPTGVRYLAEWLVRADSENSRIPTVTLSIKRKYQDA